MSFWDGVTDAIKAYASIVSSDDYKDDYYYERLAEQAADAVEIVLTYKDGSVLIVGEAGLPEPLDHEEATPIQDAIRAVSTRMVDGARVTLETDARGGWSAFVDGTGVAAAAATRDDVIRLMGEAIPMHRESVIGDLLPTRIIMDRAGVAATEARAHRDHAIREARALGAGIHLVAWATSLSEGRVRAILRAGAGS